MADRFGDAVLTIECPSCQSRAQHTLRHLGTSPEVRCLTCQSLLRWTANKSGLPSPRLRLPRKRCLMVA